MGVGLKDRTGRAIRPGDPLDLSFLQGEPGRPYLFFERTRHRLDAISHSRPPALRRAIEDLDLTYYVPCTVRGRIIAYLGASRTETGDFLSSVDVELLLTLSGYVGIAIENARLYRSLERKVEQYERLKEFSENIVESINVGILAADLDDRVESWNSQMEQLSYFPAAWPSSSSACVARLASTISTNTCCAQQRGPRPITDRPTEMVMERRPLHAKPL
jgi:GAF domain-containing protein